MAFPTFTDIVTGSSLASSAVNSIFAEVENALNGTTAVDLAANGNVLAKATGYLYIGDSTTNGSIRIGNESGSMTIESRISGTWTLIGSFILPSGE